jgi:hypothetical protein
MALRVQYKVVSDQPNVQTVEVEFASRPYLRAVGKHDHVQWRDHGRSSPVSAGQPEHRSRLAAKRHSFTLESRRRAL